MTVLKVCLLAFSSQTVIFGNSQKPSHFFQVKVHFRKVAFVSKRCSCPITVGDSRYLFAKWAADSLQQKLNTLSTSQTRLMRLLSTHNNLLHQRFANALMDVKNPTFHFFPTPSTHFQILLCHSERHQYIRWH